MPKEIPAVDEIGKQLKTILVKMNNIGTVGKDNHTEFATFSAQASKLTVDIVNQTHKFIADIGKESVESHIATHAASIKARKTQRKRSNGEVRKTRV